MKNSMKISLLVSASICSMVAISGCSSRSQWRDTGSYTPTAHTSAARHKATMRSYNVRGKRYNPTYVRVNDTMRGISSWYGPNFHGKQTSNGERYDMHAMTAAHKTWPMDTMVRVDNLKNGKSVVVRINDRGPFVSGRVIDCSYAAGRAIGLDKSGIAPVKLTVLGFAGEVYKAPTPTATSTAPAPQLPSVHLTNFAVQVGAFHRHEGAISYQQKYQAFDASKPVTIKSFDDGGVPLYRVWVTGFGSADEARDYISTYEINGGVLIRP